MPHIRDKTRFRIMEIILLNSAVLVAYRKILIYNKHIDRIFYT